MDYSGNNADLESHTANIENEKVNKLAYLLNLHSCTTCTHILAE